MSEERILDSALEAWEKINNSDPIQRVLLMNVVQGLAKALHGNGQIAGDTLTLLRQYGQWSDCISGTIVFDIHTARGEFTTTRIPFDLWPCKTKSSVRFTQRKTNLDTGAWVKKCTKTFSIDHDPEAIDQWFRDSVKFSVATIRNRS